MQRGRSPSFELFQLDMYGIMSPTVHAIATCIPVYVTVSLFNALCHNNRNIDIFHTPVHHNDS